MKGTELQIPLVRIYDFMLHSLKYAITCLERGPTVTWVSLCYEKIDMNKTDIILFLSFITCSTKTFSTPSNDENVQPEYILIV